MADNFITDKMYWLDQVSGDVAAGNLTPRALHLAFEFAQRMNRERGDARPGQEYLEERVGVSRRALRGLTEALKKRGHLDVQRGGWGKTSRYRWIIKAATDRKPASP